VLALAVLRRRLGPQAIDDLVQVAVDPARPVRLRRMAIAELGAIEAPAVARRLEALLKDPNPTIVTAAVIGLGRRGDGTTLAVLSQATIPAPAGPAAELAAALIATRTGHIVAPPGAQDTTPLRIGDGPSRTIEVTSADPALAATVLADVAGLGLALDPNQVSELTCGERRYAFVPVLNGTLTGTSSSVLGVVASFEDVEFERWLPAFFVVHAQGAARTGPQLQLRAPNGRVVHAGQLDPSSGSFRLAAVARPGGGPVEISGTFRTGQVAITAARAGLRPLRAQRAPQLERRRAPHRPSSAPEA
jgi:hypothetical protein